MTEVRDTTADTNGTAGKQRTLGLLASKGLGERLARDIAETLPESLGEHISAKVEWNVEIDHDPLTGSNVAIDDILSEIDHVRRSHEWDFAIALTDLPIRDDKRIVIARTGAELSVAVISLPPLGVIRVRQRIQDMILELMDDLCRGTMSESEPSRFLRSSQASRGFEADEQGGPRNLQYTAPPMIGLVRLLAGMVYANRPWRLLPSFKTTVATAFATGGYGLIFTTLWEIGNVYGYGRLITLMLTAMGILVTWIIISHDLWERPQKGVGRYLLMLYNASTVLTIASGVAVSYVAIFLLLLLAATVYIPTGMLESTIGHAVTPISYIRIAWVTASVATIAGAIGAGLEDTEKVQDATLGWRQLLRWQEYQRQEGKDDEPDAD